MKGKAGIHPAGKNPALVDVFSVGLVRSEHFYRVFLLGVLVQLMLTEDWF